MKLTESVRHWVLANLRYDRGDAALITYLDGLDAHRALVVYHNWASRFVPPQPRTVHSSRALEQNPLTAQKASDLALIIADIEQGRDIKKFLSRDIERAPVNVPGGKRRPDLDMLLNDWGVHHLHISLVVEADGFVKRDGPLLFVSFTPSAAYFIDIMKHGDWCRDHVLEVLASEWPHEGIIYETKTGAVSNPITERQRANLRENGYNAAFVFGGRVFMPRGLMMTGGTTMAAWAYAWHVLRRIESFEKAFTENPRRFATVFERHNLVFPDKPEFAFEIRDSGPGLTEAKTGAWIALMA